MLLGFKTELKLNNQQRTQMAQHAGTARHAYNWGLSLTKRVLNHNRDNPEDQIKFPSAIDLHKLLVAVVKPENPWYYESSKCAPQYALRNLNMAWDRAFKKTSQPPRFKKKGRNDSFTLDGAIKVVASNKIQLPKIGVVKTYEVLQVGYKPKNITVSRTANKWFISYKIEVEPSNTPKLVDRVGVDLGVKTLAYLSTGVTFANPMPYRKYEKRLRRLQWLNRNKLIGSANWKKVQVSIAKLHAKIANIRQDTIHKLTTYLAKNHSQIVIEDLNVSGMLKNGKLAKAIADMGFYEFRRQLEYKCKLYGSELIIADRWFPSSKTCSSCGWHNRELVLSDRTFDCQQCSTSIDRDWNASLNLANTVSHTGLKACG